MNRAKIIEFTINDIRLMIIGFYYFHSDNVIVIRINNRKLRTVHSEIIELQEKIPLYITNTYNLVNSEFIIQKVIDRVKLIYRSIRLHINTPTIHYIKNVYINNEDIDLIRKSITKYNYLYDLDIRNIY